MKTKILEISVLMSLIICIASSISFERDCDNIRENLLRLHIIASGDSKEEQELKLKVRDAVLEEGAAVFSQNDTLGSAREKIEKNLALLRKTAENTVKQQGYTYPVKAELTKCYFPTRVYENITLPAGTYNALRVIIGEGAGQNWWCVMFPPMCLPAASEGEAELENILDKKSIDIIKNSRRYEVRLWIVEKWYELSERVASSQYPVVR